jgi:2-polyprenyl-3-methyl-5-hydroxy-6-metoxy-1,4-benzoquinol methylase
MTSESSAGSVRYARAINLDDRRNPHTLAVLLVGDDDGARVLDVGTSTGAVAGALRARGARVWGIEIDEDAATEAAKVCEQLVIGDVEQLDLYAELDQHEFDWLLLLDVLEHLREPLETLRRCTSLLAPGGRVLISIPNIAHASVRLQLLRGHFQYTETGLLDRTHLRFFDRTSMIELLASAGLRVETELPIRHSPEEEGVDWEALPSEVRRELEGDSASDIYQFVVVARPVAGESPSPNGLVGAATRATLLGRLWARVDELEKQVDAGDAYVASVLEQIAEHERRAERADELEGVIAERMNQLAARDRELKHLHLTLGLKEQQITEMRGRLGEATREAAEAASLRGYVVGLEQQNAELIEHSKYARYRAADWLSGVVKGVPGVHRVAKLVTELLFARRRR